MLNMHIAKDDLRAAAVIRETAMRLFADRGAAAVTVREIAAAAGVSPGLVIHHYGSKDGLKDAVDRRAVAFFEEMIGEFGQLGEEGGGASLVELFADRLESEPAMVGYIRRLLLDGGEAADGLFARLLDATEAGMRALAVAGVVRPAPDERVRTAFLLANDLSLVLLRRHIARSVGFDPLTREGLGPWSAAVLDVYTSGVFAFPAAPEAPGEAGSNERPAGEGQNP
jgi:TetR/AcrR family transcriptional regulator, regulator of cefoperazone and chloramphenicol sensitivity